MLGIFVLLWRFVTFYLNIILGSLAGLLIVRREVSVRSKNEEIRKQEQGKISEIGKGDDSGEGD
jgi:hypothetical protein